MAITSTFQFLAFALLASSSMQVTPADQWISLSTPDFQLYTKQSPESGDRILQALEQTRYFFLKSGLFALDSATPLRIFICPTGHYVSADRGRAYYQRGRKADYIVLQGLSQGYEQTAIHEYTHFVLQHSGVKLPVWLREGLADLYSTVEPHGSQVLIGRALPGRLFTLRTKPPIDWGLLLTIDHDSPYYSQPADAPRFYAQSWALTHMLAIGSAYSPRFDAFVKSLQSGQSALDSFRLIYAKTLDQVGADFEAYLRQTNLPVRAFDVDLNRLNFRIARSMAAQERIDVTLADLLASNPYTQSEAEARLVEISKQYPVNPEPEESLGYIALREHKTEEARLHFASAIQRQSNDPDVILNYARLQQLSGAPAEQIMALLERVLSIAPGRQDARLELGLLRAQSQQFALALATLSELKPPPSSHSSTYFYAIAYCQAHLRNMEAAKEYATEALRSAQNPAEQLQAGKLLRYIDHELPGTAP
jgi:hypothetical protein